MVWFAFCLLGLLSDTVSAWSRPNSLFTNTTDASSYGCDKSCQSILDQKTALDRSSDYQDVPFDADFYATAASFSPSKSRPGDVLKLEPYSHITDAWKLPGGTTLYRMQYVSQGPNNESLPATSFIAFPFSTEAEAPDHRYRWVAFAHGTCGSHYGCAPSSSLRLYDYDTISPLLLNGYAVVASDYVGLGNNYTRHRWLDNKSNAIDVYFSAVAAKKAFPLVLGDEWAASGHSQGGGAVWGLVESDLVVSAGREYAGDLNMRFVGGVSIEPGMRILDQAKVNAAGSKRKRAPSASLGYATSDVEALLAFDPDSVPRIFSAKLLKRIELSNRMGTCEVADLYLANGMQEEEIYASRYAQVYEETFSRYQQQTSAGLGVSPKAPLLVIQSTADTTVPYQMVELAYNDTCQAGGEPVQLSLYGALDHSPMPGASAAEWLRWIADRFAGQPRPTICQARKRKAYNRADACLECAG